MIYYNLGSLIHFWITKDEWAKLINVTPKHYLKETYSKNTHPLIKFYALHDNKSINAVVPTSLSSIYLNYQALFYAYLHYLALKKYTILYVEILILSNKTDI